MKLMAKDLMIAFKIILSYGEVYFVVINTHNFMFEDDTRDDKENW